VALSAINLNGAVHIGSGRYYGFIHPMWLTRDNPPAAGPGPAAHLPLMPSLGTFTLSQFRRAF